MGVSRKRDCVLPTDWTVDKYWIAVDRMIQAEPEAKVLYKDGPYYWPSRKPTHPGFRVVKRGGKYIVMLPSLEAAEVLHRRLDALPSRLQLRQTVAAARGDLNLSVKPAYKAKRCTAKEAAKDLEDLIKRTEALNELSGEQDSLFAAWLVVGYRNRKELATYRSQHGDDAAVTVRKTSSFYWRLNWFNPERNKRQQANVGDIVIVYPVGPIDSIGTVRKADEREPRSDSGRFHRICRNSVMEVIDREK